MDSHVDNTISGIVPTFPTSLTLIPEFEEYYPNITERDIDNGSIIRYFVRQANHSKGDITEIDQKTYVRLKNNRLFKVITLSWKITGPLDDVAGPNKVNSPVRLLTGVNTANRLAIEDADKEMLGLKYKLTNYSQFWTE